MRNQKHFWGLLIALLVLQLPLFAQQGAVSGTIVDQNTGETLIGANVVVEGTAVGTATDFDGKYQFALAPGVYTLVFSYIGYNETKVEGVEIDPNETTVIDMGLSDDAMELDLEVVVQAKAVERTANALLLLQKRSDKIQDGISSQEIARLGVSDAAGALRKVTGTTVVDGKYVYVRGLGDRYSSTTLNGLRLPSIDPYRNSAQMDLIPTNLLDNIIASKTFTPDLPGDFTGGSVNVQMKSLPERFTFNVSTSVTYNELSSFQDNFLTFNAGNTAWLGFNDGTLDQPAILTSTAVMEENILSQTAASRARTNDEAARLLDESVRSLNSQFVPTTETAPLDHSFSLSLGNQFDLGGTPLGVLFTMNYSNAFSYYNNGMRASYFNPGPDAETLFSNFELADTRAIETPRLGGLFGLSLRPSPNHSLNFYTIYSHQTAIEGRLLAGDQNDYGFGAPEVFQTRTLSFTERELVDYVLSGEHVLPGLNNLKIEWAGSFANTSQNEPDLRFFANAYDPDRDRYTIAISAFDLPGHYFRTLEDQSFQGKVDFTLPILQSKSNANKFKFGGLYTTKERDFSEKVYTLFNRQGNNFTGDPETYFGTDNIGVINDEPGNNRIGLYLIDQSRLQNTYSGETNIWASYGMFTFQVTPRLKVIAGGRLEGTQIYVESAAAEVSPNPENEIADIDVMDFLPAGHLVYSLTDDMNLRAAYTNTQARPNMREVAPFGAFGFIGDPEIFGNPDLVRSRIDNFDLRYEYFMRPGELFAVSGFYKLFKDPIVQTFRPAGNPQFTWRNTENAALYGVEVEFRKSLDFISPAMRNFSFSGNMAFIYSNVDLDSTELAINRDIDPEFPAQRQFAGQSPFVANANLSFNSPETGWDAVIAYNYFGDRLSAVGVEGSPDIFELGRSQLDFTLSKEIGRVTLKVRAINLLDPDYRTFSEFRGEEYTYSLFRRGRSFSFGVSYGI